MKLWLISQDSNYDYDTYDSAVVAAETEEEARKTLPWDHDYAYSWDEQGRLLTINVEHRAKEKWKLADSDSWVNRLSQVRVEYLGEARDGHPAGVVLASFNAG